MFKKIILLVFLSSSLSAQVDWFGYYEGEGDWGKTPDLSIYYGYNKLRLDMDSSPSDNIRISANLIYKQFNGQTSLNFMDFIHPKYYPVVPTPDGLGLDTTSYIPYSLTDTMFIDNMFMEFHHKLFDLTLGKQQISPGVGYAWNPTDIFNLKDLMDPTYENSGISAIKLSIPFGYRTTLSGILQPENSWNETIQYYQLKTGIGQFDFSLIYGKKNPLQLIPEIDTVLVTGIDEYGNYIGNIAVPYTKYIGPYNIPHDLYGFNLEGELLGIGIRSEIATHRINCNNDNLQYEFVIGADYTFVNSLYLLTEFYHSDLGTKTGQTGFDDYLVYFSGERKSLNQNYLFALAMFPLGDLLDVSAFGIINLDDKSAVIAPQLIYRIFQDVELSILGSWFVGDNTDEYGYQEFGARFRIRAYF
ncbi:hypothetical protein KJ762_05815 [bacterium]|nr:hypothetical protein [bacterium]MBU1064457.1 hypothetical protein [bacterium]MBU1634011.1 hypothetical protein [bacterium]MBU1874866.1 hypothetical protein [bacterium]